MVTPWLKGRHLPARPLMAPTRRGDLASSTPQVCESLWIPSGTPRPPRLTPRAWQPSQGSTDGPGGALTLLWSCSPSPTGLPKPGVSSSPSPTDLEVLLPQNGPAALHRLSRGSCRPGVHLQPLTHGPRGSADPGVPAAPHPRVRLSCPRMLLQPLTDSSGGPPAPGGSCSPSPGARRSTVRRRGSNLRPPRLGGGLASRNHSDAAAPAGPRNLAGPRPFPACLGACP